MRFRIVVASLLLVAALTATSQQTDFMRIGNEALNQKKYEIAIEYFDKAILFQPNAHAAIYNRGVAHSKLGKDTLAIADFTYYLTILPDNPTALTARGVLYHKLGKRQDAINDLTKSLEIEPANGLAWAVLGDAYLTMRLLDKALEAWKNSVSRDPKGPYAGHVQEQIVRLTKSAQPSK